MLFHTNCVWWLQNTHVSHVNSKCTNNNAHLNHVIVSNIKLYTSSLLVMPEHCFHHLMKWVQAISAVLCWPFRHPIHIRSRCMVSTNKKKETAYIELSILRGGDRNGRKIRMKLHILFVYSAEILTWKCNLCQNSWLGQQKEKENNLLSQVMLYGTIFSSLFSKFVCWINGVWEFPMRLFTDNNLLFIKPMRTL